MWTNLSAHPSARGPHLNSRIEHEDEQDPESSHQSASQSYGARHNSTESSTSRGRPTRACDSCSMRKIKCKGDAVPCTPCGLSDIICTFDRPSRRRGPASKAVMSSLSRRNIEMTTTRTSHVSVVQLQSVASAVSISTCPVPLLAESICDIPSLQALIDDYFTFIHPLIPLPHEPSFRAAFARRDDRVDRGFVALLAAMIEVLVASFPRRPLRLFASEQAKRHYENAGALIDQCHTVFNEARGLGFADREASLTDALSSYLAGLAAGYLFDMSRQRRYMSECVVILRTLGFQTAQDSLRDGSIIDHVYQQSGRRLFWLCFAGALSVRQLGGYDSDILMPPTVYSEKLPPLPLEIDDEYIYPSTIFDQPTNVVSIMCGFNLNIQLFRSFHHLIALETLFGGDTVYNWGRQRQIIRRALSEVKTITQNAPDVLRLEKSDREIQQSQVSGESSISHTLRMNGLRNDQPADFQHPIAAGETQNWGRMNQYEIQKANIYATQLATRSFLVEKYWNLLEIRDREQALTPSTHFDPIATAVSPTPRCVASGLEAHCQTSDGTLSEFQSGDEEQTLAIEREDIVRDMAVLLRSIKQINMEPNGLSFCNKIRQVASTLLDQDRGRMAVMPSLDSEIVNNYLLEFCAILAKLERLGPQRIRDSDQQGGSAQDAEDEALVYWASLKEHQERFIRSEGFLANANV